MIFSKDQLRTLKNNIKLRLSEYRYIHTIGVKNVAIKIASFCYDGDISEIEAAALLHDISKEYSLEEQYDMIKKSQIHLTDTDMMSETVFHAFTAPVVICCDFNDFSTQNILSSAFNHTTGDENMSLFDEIIFIADYVEENRKHPNCIKVRDDLYRSFELSRNKEECVSHLHNATVQALDFTISHLLKNGNIINLRTVKTRNAFLGRLPMLINDLQKGI